MDEPKELVYGIYIPTRIHNEKLWLHLGPNGYYYARFDKRFVYTFDTEERAQLAANAPDIPIGNFIGSIPKLIVG